MDSAVDPYVCRTHHPARCFAAPQGAGDDCEPNDSDAYDKAEGFGDYEETT